MLRKHFIIALAVLPAYALAADDHDDHDDHGHEEHGHEEHGSGDDKHVTEIEGLRIVHAWARASEGPVAQVFMEIENSADVVRVLTGAETGIAAHVHVMGAPIQAGGEPVELGTFEIPAGTDFDLVPDGVYLALEGLSEDLHEGDEFEMTVVFEDVTLEVHVEVEAADASQHGHAGHNH